MSRQFEGTKMVRVFMMTPHAETTEQAAFRDVIAEANDVKARAHGVQFKPLGGSDSILGRLRAKTRSAKDLLTADLVVAALDRHWDAGAAERFEALYDLACEHDKTVWLYVRTLDDAHLADPDDQLRHLLDFRDHTEQDGRALTARYDDETSWPDMLLKHLFNWLDNRPPDSSLGPVSTDGLVARLAIFTASEPAPAPETLDRIQEAWTAAQAGRLTRARELFARIVADIPMHVVHAEYARFLGHFGMLDEAEGFYAKALDGASAEVEALVAAGYTLLGHAHEDRADLGAAKRLYREALHINDRLDRPEAMAADYGKLGNVYWMLSDLEKAEQAYRASLALNERLGRREAMAADYGNLGNVFGVWGRLDQAEEMYGKALALNEELGRQDRMANQYGNLGIIYRVQGRLDEAEDVYCKALEINRAEGRREGMAEDYNNLGNVYQERGCLDEAEQMYRKALEIDEALGRDEGMANQYGNLGIVYQARKMFDEAEQMYHRALAIFETLGDFVTIEQVRIWITDLEAHRRLQ